MNCLPVIFENAYRNMSDGIIAFDAEEKILFVNRTAERILKCQEETLLGTAIKELFDGSRMIIDDDGCSLEIGDYIIRFISNSKFRTPWYKTVAGEFADNDGKTCWMLVFSYIYNSRHSQSSTVAAEEAFSTNQTRIFIKDIDAGGVYIQCNNTFAESINYSREEVIGRRDIDLFSAEDTATFRKGDLQALKQQTPIFSNLSCATVSDGQRCSTPLNLPSITPKGISAYAQL